MTAVAQVAPDDAGISATKDEHSAVLAFIALAWASAVGGAPPPDRSLLEGFAELEAERSRRRFAPPHPPEAG